MSELNPVYADLEAARMRIRELESKLSTSEHDLAVSEEGRVRLALRLDSALVFVNYIAKRYEEGWDDPITERFYNEAKALLDGVVETHPHDVWGDGRCPINCDSPEVRCSLPVGHSGPHIADWSE